MLDASCVHGTDPSKGAPGMATVEHQSMNSSFTACSIAGASAREKALGERFEFRSSRTNQLEETVVPFSLVGRVLWRHMRDPAQQASRLGRRIGGERIHRSCGE